MTTWARDEKLLDSSKSYLDQLQPLPLPPFLSNFLRPFYFVPLGLRAPLNQAFQCIAVFAASPFSIFFPSTRRVGGAHMLVESNRKRRRTERYFALLFANFLLFFFGGLVLRWSVFRVLADGNGERLETMLAHGSTSGLFERAGGVICYGDFSIRSIICLCGNTII